jgi:murein L,D-transpeptidase YafK
MADRQFVRILKYLRMTVCGKSLAFITSVLLVLFLLALPFGVFSRPAKQVDRILIQKKKRSLSPMSGNEVLKTYKVALGTEPVEPQERQGDHRTPEGMYSVDRKIPNSQFHKALHTSYPNAADREHARKLGVSPGGDVEIHGLGAEWGWVGSNHTLKDWTDGCIAVTNEEIDAIYPQVSPGTVVEILP